MNIEIVKKDLFTMPQGYYLAHCISADFKLGAGIAKMFDSVYNMRNKLITSNVGYNFIDGDAILIDNVFNLVTKEKYWHKPTYSSISFAINCMADICKQRGITKLAMPKIGCGLDKLDWDEVYDIILDAFEDLDIDIVICEL